MSCMHVYALHVCLCPAYMQCWWQKSEELPGSYISLCRHGELAYLFMRANIPTTKHIILPLWCVCGSKHIHTATNHPHLSPPECSPPQNETLNSLNRNSPFSLLPAPGSPHSINSFLSCELTIPGTPYKKSFTTFSFCVWFNYLFKISAIILATMLAVLQLFWILRQSLNV